MRFAGSRSARASAVSRTMSCSPPAMRCALRLDEAVLSTPWGAQSEWAQHPLLVTLHREAWGGEKFFEMLRPDLAGSGSPYRSDGAAVSLPRVGLRGQIPGRASAATRGSRKCSPICTGGSGSSRRAAPGALAPLARNGGPAQSADSLCALVGRRGCFAGDPRRHVHLLLLPASPASRHRCTPSLPRSGLEDFSPAARRRLPPVARHSSSCWPTMKQRGALSVEEQAAVEPWSRCSPPISSLPAAPRSTRSINDDAAASGARARPGAGPRSRRGTHRRSAAQIAALPGQLRAVARARGSSVVKLLQPTSTAARG